MILSGVPGTVISGVITSQQRGGLELKLGLRTISKITSYMFLHAHTDAPHSIARLEIVRTEMFPSQRPGWSNLRHGARQPSEMRPGQLSGPVLY